MIPNPKAIRSFADERAFETWLSRNGERETELWIKIYKKGSGKPSIDASQAIDVALCWGWIDGIRKSFDGEAFLQRFTPRRAKSRWSQINRDRVERLIAAGRMTARGMREVDAAKRDGRWAAAYPSPAKIEVPADLMAAIEAHPKALAAFRGLNRTNFFALAYRMHHLKTPAGRAKRIADFVAMLARGETPHPNPSPKPKPAPSAKPPRAGAAARERKPAKAERPQPGRVAAKRAKPGAGTTKKRAAPKRRTP